MLVVRVQTVLEGRESGEVLTDNVIVAHTIGAALDRHAPDPREGATFRVTLVAKDAEVIA